jgi:hypothetical protein
MPSCDARGPKARRIGPGRGRAWTYLILALASGCATAQNDAASRTPRAVAQPTEPAPPALLGELVARAREEFQRTVTEDGADVGCAPLVTLTNRLLAATKPEHVLFIACTASGSERTPEGCRDQDDQDDGERTGEAGPSCNVTQWSKTTTYRAVPSRPDDGIDLWSSASSGFEHSFSWSTPRAIEGPPGVTAAVLDEGSGGSDAGDEHIVRVTKLDSGDAVRIDAQQLRVELRPHGVIAWEPLTGSACAEPCQLDPAATSDGASCTVVHEIENRADRLTQKTHVEGCLAR